MKQISSFKDLTVWQVSMDLADVRFDIVDRAYLNHLSYSLGSHAQVETLFELIRRRKLVPDALLAKGVVHVEPVGRMLHGLVESLETRLKAQHP